MMSQEQDRRAAAEAAVAAHDALLLGIAAPRWLRRVLLEWPGNKVEIEVQWDRRAAVSCPQCGRECPRHDHAPGRQCRHLDVMQFTTIIRARVPRSRGEEHGVNTLRVPWAEPGSRFTLHFEALAVQVIEACRSLTQAAELLKLDRDSVQRIVERAVERGMLRRSTEQLRRDGLDEKSFGRGQDYVSVMTDLDGARVLEVVAGRDKDSALALWKTIPTQQRDNIQAAAMDMGANFACATRQAAPKAAIVHDRFHISMHLNEAVDKVRREEHRRLLEAGDDSLSGTRYLPLQGVAPGGDRALTFKDLCERNLKTARAWCHKETFAEFWIQGSAERGAKFFQNWFGTVARSKLEPLKKVARTLKEHLSGLINYFTHPITNALTEDSNSRIQAIKADAHGFRRLENHSTRILFFFGKLDMAPCIQSPVTCTIP